MAQFTVTRGGHTNSSLTDRPAKVRCFETYGAAHAHLETQLQKLRRDGYKIEYKRTLSDLTADLTAEVPPARLDPAIWRVSARRGVMRGRGLFFTLRSDELTESLSVAEEA
jgi:hypothetical protein